LLSLAFTEATFVESCMTTHFKSEKNLEYDSNIDLHVRVEVRDWGSMRVRPIGDRK